MCQGGVCHPVAFVISCTAASELHKKPLPQSNWNCGSGILKRYTVLAHSVTSRPGTIQISW